MPWRTGGILFLDKMLEKPKSYEEARHIIENAVEDDWQTKDLKKAKLRLVLAVVTAVVAAVVTGIMTGDLTLGIIVLLNALIIASPFSIPYLRRKRVTDAVHNGSYFDKVDDDEMMDAAIQYVDLYNEREERAQNTAQ